MSSFDDIFKAVEKKEGKLMNDGVTLIAIERKRQIKKEEWTATHDDRHDNCELVDAAICYAYPYTKYPSVIPKHWPWDSRWWKPTNNDRVRELVKAGALLAAEIDRLQRLPEDPKDE